MGLNQTETNLCGQRYIQSFFQKKSIGDPFLLKFEALSDQVKDPDLDRQQTPQTHQKSIYMEMRT